MAYTEIEKGERTQSGHGRVRKCLRCYLDQYIQIKGECEVISVERGTSERHPVVSKKVWRPKLVAKVLNLVETDKRLPFEDHEVLISDLNFKLWENDIESLVDVVGNINEEVDKLDCMLDSRQDIMDGIGLSLQELLATCIDLNVGMQSYGDVDAFTLEKCFNVNDLLALDVDGKNTLEADGTIALEM
ncbi:hypothetical protein VNO78_14870 [Psophocarpus tetragonolobus]|uniref:Uncharacterized protein n=1 Tax=Psophocarpus tetragonolobus TaxID=3891 RepID=A0AAN9XIN8_PSOTE